MRCLRLTLLPLLIVASSCADQPVQPDTDLLSYSRMDAQSNQVMNGRYIVLFRGHGVPGSFATDVEALGGVVEYSHEIGVAVVAGLSDSDASALARSRAVQDIHPDFAVEFEPAITSGPTAADGPLSAAEPTGAYFYSRQWNMRAVQADAAWAAGRVGSEDVTVAILDTGIDYTYPDLLGRVDLSRSISFIPEDDAYVDYFFPGKHHVTDIHYHGTHVASIVVSNADVTAGVTSQTTLIGVKVCSAVTGSCPFGAVIPGFLHAVDNGADVINMSLGGGFSRAGNGWYVGYINRVFNYAREAGVTVVVAAGNDAFDLDHNRNEYTTYCDAPGVLCVAATGPTGAEGVNGPWTDVDAPAPYTNYGMSAITVAAPGGTSAGYVWAACSQTSLVIPICQTGTYALGVSGTSQASPHVAGLAALVVEVLGRDPAAVSARIRAYADDLGKPGRDPYYGMGRINVFATVGH